MLFWIIATCLAGGTGLWLARSLIAPVEDAQGAAAYDLQVYRAQLAEVDRDLERGIISDEDAERLRIEVSRRILTADKASSENAPAQGSAQVWVYGVVAVVLCGAAGLYGWLGAPGVPDLPRSERIAASDALRAERLSQVAAELAHGSAPAQVEVDPEFSELIERLRQVVADNPQDQQGLALLARNEALLGNAKAAYQAQAQLIGLTGGAATDHTFLADLMITAAGGYVSKEAEEALRQALVMDPRQQTAQYYLGLYYTQVDRPDAAFRLWDGLLRNSTPNAPWVAPIRGQILGLASAAGVARYELPEQFGEDTEMIEGMVAGLAERLANEGGTAQDWARLIHSYGVLGQRDRAATVWTEAQDLFAARPDQLEVIREGAVSAGVAQ